LACSLLDPVWSKGRGAVECANYAAEHAGDGVGIPAETGGLHQGVVRVVPAEP
jgi:hypothetical protein